MEEKYSVMINPIKSYIIDLNKFLLETCIAMAKGVPHKKEHFAVVFEKVIKIYNMLDVFPEQYNLMFDVDSVQTMLDGLENTLEYGDTIAIADILEFEILQILNNTLENLDKVR